MSAKIEIEQDYSLAHSIGGALDLDLDNININHLPKIQLESNNTIQTKNSIDSDSKLSMQSDNKLSLKSDNKIDLGLDNIRIKELPRIDLHFSAKPTRIHYPVNYKLAFGALGYELLAFNVCGEGMVIVEDYKKHCQEGCED